MSQVEAEWSSSVARRAHNPKVVGSNPASATKFLSKVSFSLELAFVFSGKCEQRRFFMEGFAVRNSVKIILLDPENKVLLIGMDNKNIKSANGKYNGKFWNLVGGKIEEGEDLLAAARRELFEETGLRSESVSFGKVVWSGELVLDINGVKTLTRQRFIVARTSTNFVALKNLTREEKMFERGLKWFSLYKIKNSNEVIYPVGLDEYLSDLLVNGVPNKPIKIALDKKPNVKLSV